MRSKINISLKIILAVITIAMGAQVTIDVGNIPITGQTLAILCWAFFLSPGEAIIALISYLVLGISGAPVFADGAFGIEKLYGGSGGYLLGFLIAASFVSYVYNHFKSNSFVFIFGLTTIGTIIILIFGVGRLVILYDLEKGIAYGLIPFWQGALIKILIGSIIVWFIKQCLHKCK